MTAMVVRIKIIYLCEHNCFLSCQNLDWFVSLFICCGWVGYILQYLCVSEGKIRIKYCLKINRCFQLFVATAKTMSTDYPCSREHCRVEQS